MLRWLVCLRCYCLNESFLKIWDIAHSFVEKLFSYLVLISNLELWMGLWVIFVVIKSIVYGFNWRFAGWASYWINVWTSMFHWVISHSALQVFFCSWSFTIVSYACYDSFVATSHVFQAWIRGVGRYLWSSLHLWLFLPLLSHLWHFLIWPLRSSHLPEHLFSIQNDPLIILLELLKKLDESSACILSAFLATVFDGNILIFLNIICKPLFIMVLDQLNSTLNIFKLQYLPNNVSFCDSFELSDSLWPKSLSHW